MALGGGGGGSSDGHGRRRECLEYAADGGTSGGGAGDGRRGRTATERSGEARCSGEDNEFGTASVDGEAKQDHVKTVVRVEGSRHTKGEGSGWLTGVGIRR